MSSQALAYTLLATFGATCFGWILLERVGLWVDERRGVYDQAYQDAVAQVLALTQPTADPDAPLCIETFCNNLATTHRLNGMIGEHEVTELVCWRHAGSEWSA